MTRQERATEELYQDYLLLLDRTVGSPTAAVLINRRIANTARVQNDVLLLKAMRAKLMCQIEAAEGRHAVAR